MNWKRFTKKNRERDKRELDLSKKPKVLVTVNKIKELFPETCRACGGAISLKQTMSGNVLKHYSETVTVGTLEPGLPQMFLL